MTADKPKSSLKIEEHHQGFVVRTANKRSFLITFYTPKKGAPVVLLQASHSPFSKQFSDFNAAVRYLEMFALEDP